MANLNNDIASVQFEQMKIIKDGFGDKKKQNFFIFLCFFQLFLT